MRRETRNSLGKARHTEGAAGRVKEVPMSASVRRTTKSKMQTHNGNGCSKQQRGECHLPFKYLTFVSTIQPIDTWRLLDSLSIAAKAFTGNVARLTLTFPLSTRTLPIQPKAKLRENTQTHIHDAGTHTDATRKHCTEHSRKAAADSIESIERVVDCVRPVGRHSPSANVFFILETCVWQSPVSGAICWLCLVLSVLCRAHGLSPSRFSRYPPSAWSAFHARCVCVFEIKGRAFNSYTHTETCVCARA